MPGLRFLVLQHARCEHPGAMTALLRERRIAYDVVELDEGEPLPDPLAYDALLVFGGPMNVDEEDEHPWLAAEKRAIGRAVGAGVPYLGLCLGAQLLARALGARVYAAAAPEIGVLEVSLAAAARSDPLLGGLPDPLPCFQWHGDTFDLPAGATLLASSPVCRNQAFRAGEAAWGLQFHVEATSEMAAEWAAIPEYCASLDRPVAELQEALAARADELALICERVFDGFVEVASRHQHEATRDVAAPHPV